MVLYTRHTVVFFDASYPHFCSEKMLRELVPGAFTLADAAHLAEELQDSEATLVSFHGPYFPKAAWRAILRFLESGGNLAIFGGMPFSRPVNEAGALEPEQDVYTRQLALGLFHQVIPGEGALRFQTDQQAAFLGDSWLVSEDAPGDFWAFYPQMTQVSDHPEDMGSSGPFDTVLLPLVYAQGPTSVGLQNVATPVLALDQRQGRFCGGRWLISAWRPSSLEGWSANAEAIGRVISFAAEGATSQCEVSPALATYRPGEQAVLLVSARTRRALQARGTVYCSDQQEPLMTFEATFPASPARQQRAWSLPALSRPGLYQVSLEYQCAGGLPFTMRSGFWIWDEALVESTRGQALEAGRDYFTRQGETFFVFGTTHMDSQTQRKFLHLPNPSRLDQDLATMRASGINLIRTGLWTAWRELVPISGSANEAFLRALDSFVLTACKHTMQVIFTFFSFFPLLFEGENPWLDPRSLEAQRDFVALLAGRYADVELVSWDLINEPSFGDPRRIFALRPIPSYDRFEVAAFQSWLKERYTLSELQLRWRQTPADIPAWEQVMPPREADYDTYVRSTTTRLALKVADFTHFSQEMFTRWAAQMVEALRAAGCRTLIGVGQDESATRLAPQYYASAVDYTTTHPWWNIDDMLWDMLLDKTPEKPNLIQETGVMLARDIDARPWRDEWENARLLERKLFMGLAARGAGLIQWLWFVNAYMVNDNENSIGLVRPDGSVKPELEAMLGFGCLVKALEGRLFAEPAPDVWLVIPYSQWFTRPEAARHGTQRAARVLAYDLGVLPQCIGEHQLARLADASPRPRAVLVPALQLLNPQAWSHLLAYTRAGGTLLVNGVLARDQHNLPFDPLIAGLAAEVQPTPVSLYETLTDGAGETYQLTFLHEATNYVKKAHNQVLTYPYGAGQLIWSGLPLELASETTALKILYRRALQQPPMDEPEGTRPYLLTLRSLRDGLLFVVISESSSSHCIALPRADLEITIEPNRAGALLLNNDGSIRTFGGLHLP